MLRCPTHWIPFWTKRIPSTRAIIWKWAGLGRKLTRPEHYEVLKGQKVRAKLIRPNADGVRELSGILTGREGSTVTLETENGSVTFEVNAVSGVQLCDDEDLFN